MKTLTPSAQSLQPLGNSPFYSDLRDRMLAELVRDSKVGTKLPSERELARQFNVSNVTIARVMQELQRGGIVNRIPGKGTFLRHLPLAAELSILQRTNKNERNGHEPAAQSLVPQRLETASFDASDAHVAIVAAFELTPQQENRHHWAHRAMSHIERMIQKSGGRTAITNFHSVALDDIADWLQGLLAKGVNGVIFIGGPIQQGNQAWLNQLLRLVEEKKYRQFPITIIDFDQSSLQPVDAVRYNGEVGAFLATRHLLQLGHRKIAFLVPGESTDWLSERLHGFRRAFEWFREAVGDENLIAADSLPPDFDHAATSHWEWCGQSAAAHFLEAGSFTAAVVANDQMAVELLKMAQERGLQVPGNFSVVGFDDSQQSREMHLTTVHPPIEEMAERAALITLQRLREPKAEEHVEIVLNPALVIRSSTGTAVPI